jgi:hypothetical protein
MKRSRWPTDTPRRVRSSLHVVVALVLAACIPPSSTAPSPSAGATSSATGSGQVCEFFGARFIALPGYKVEEQREAGEPISRVSLSGREGTHGVLVSIIPRELGTSAEATKAGQTRAYFQALRSAFTNWTDVEERTFQAPARTYPVLFSRERVAGPLPGLGQQHDNAVLLYFPDDFPKDRYFYVFFWTDVHGVDGQPLALSGLQTLVDSFSIKSSPAGAPSKGCS